MIKIVLYTDDNDFKEDFSVQINRFLENALFVENTPDVVVVDENEDIYRRLREQYPFVPIIFLTNKITDESDERLNIMVKKPFSLMHLLDIIRAANNKLDNSEDGYLYFNDYELRPKNKEIVDLQTGKIIRLTEKEVDILQYLYKTSGQYVSKTDLQTSVWQYHEEVTTHTIETHIYRVRQKVETSGGRRLILTNNGAYKLNVGE